MIITNRVSGPSYSTSHTAASVRSSFAAPTSAAADRDERAAYHRGRIPANAIQLSSLAPSAPRRAAVPAAFAALTAATGFVLTLLAK